jgi:hypothetical protein
VIDYCLKNTDEAEFNQLMLDTGLCVEVTEGEDTTVVPADYTILIDRIGPITIGEITYPEYYSNLRLLTDPTEKQVEMLSKYAIDPSQPQYRTWL